MRLLGMQYTILNKDLKYDDMIDSCKQIIIKSSYLVLLFF
jgi:hypothetical protein